MLGDTCTGEEEVLEYRYKGGSRRHLEHVRMTIVVRDSDR